MSHEQGKAAVVVNSGRGHLGFKFKFILRGKFLGGGVRLLPSWQPYVGRTYHPIHGSERVSHSSCNCPVIYYLCSIENVRSAIGLACNTTGF